MAYCSNTCTSSCGCNGCTGHWPCHHGATGCASSCPYPEWMHPIHCNPTRYCCAGAENGATLVVHQIILEANGGQTCTPRTFNIRITGPSYPTGEVFPLRAGSCIELDEPLVVSGLIPGTYTIEPLADCRRRFISTITGPVCGNTVQLTACVVPTVVTIVSRRRTGGCGCGWWNETGYSCGCGTHTACGTCGACNTCNTCGTCNTSC